MEAISNIRNFEEFCEVFRSLNGWKNVFVQHDRDRSGTMEGAELHRVLIDLGKLAGWTTLLQTHRRFFQRYILFL